MDLSDVQEFSFIRKTFRAIATAIKALYANLSSSQRVMTFIYIALLTGFFAGSLPMIFSALVSFLFYKKLKNSDVGKLNMLFIRHLEQGFKVPLIFLAISAVCLFINASLSHTVKIPAEIITSVNKVVWVSFFFNIVYYHAVVLINLVLLFKKKDPLFNYLRLLRLLLLLPRAMKDGLAHYRKKKKKNNKGAE
ncbi:hypothetical protein [Photobacterium leiognathi]|uniref:hypothetical protein n=1 Tax=Photobacterium leiognathi TaxID=553611 RepID=UPI0029829B37|nr:hypothetical protein [Photobacterium leiognathi]